MPGGQYGLVYIISGLFGAAIVYGVPWLVGAILPFVESPSLDSTTGQVLCGVGAFAGFLLAQIALSGWGETWRSWAMWALFVVLIFGLSAIGSWYIQANPDSALLETITELVKKAPIEEEASPLLLFIGIPIVLFVIMCAIAILKGDSGGASRR